MNNSGSFSAICSSIFNAIPSSYISIADNPEEASDLAYPVMINKIHIYASKYTK